MTKVLPNTNEKWKEVYTEPCKCCGSEAIIGGEPMWEWWQHYIECSNIYCKDRCSGKISSGTSPIEDIVKKWNERNVVIKEVADA